MSSALQKLLARPSSLALLRYLIREPALEHALQRASKVPYICTRHVLYQPYAMAAAKVPGKELSPSRAVVDEAIDAEPQLLKSPNDHLQPEPVIPSESPNEPLIPPILDASGSPTAWGACLRTYEEVEFQSNLGPHIGDSKKLVDDPEFSNDFTLWAYLLDFRKRRYGNVGVGIFWAAVRKRGLLLPTEGSIAETFWSTFLQAGFEDKEMLQDICKYADELYDSSGKHWSKLYMYIIQHIILKEEPDTLVLWHERLIERHPPGPAVFSKLVRNIVLMRGDLGALKLLYKTKFYKTHNTYKTYGKIIPILIGREDFHTAMQWHFFLVRRGDYPLNQKVVKPLIDHFAIYDPSKARRLMISLVSTGVPFADSVSDGLEGSETISREMMNLIHGKTFGIEPKKYSDRLGARWFATNWISLDLAINTVHALGVQEIGPLSLQAIALREADPSGVVHRIEQLKQLGISIGSSVFSRAVESFARDREVEYLQGLLKSDQHPDSYEDRWLQEDLLASYARTEDWAQYRLTTAIRVVGSRNSRVEQYNLIQQANLFRGDRPAVFKMLEEMRVQRIPVSQKTIPRIVWHFLSTRRKGHAPDPRRKSLDDLQTAISILTTIMKFGSSVPATSWREIIRRLGMLGRFDDLEKLCLWLAAWYNPDSTLRLQSVENLSPVLSNNSSLLAPAQVPTSHSLHPLRILFSNALQRAIVEWGFKHEPLRQPFQSIIVLEESNIVDNLAERSAYHYTRGVKLLRQLQYEGVYVDVAQIRRALRNRFAILYNPGESRVVRNGRLRQQNVSTREDMVVQLNNAWGADIWLWKRFSNGRRRFSNRRRNVIPGLVGRRLR
jgi:hypothetical protein